MTLDQIRFKQYSSTGFIAKTGSNIKNIQVRKEIQRAISSKSIVDISKKFGYNYNDKLELELNESIYK